MGRGRLRALTGFKSVQEAPRFDYGNLVNGGALPGGSNEVLKDPEALGVGGHPVCIEALIYFWDDVCRISPG
jgi:hypothetical protein